MQAFLITVEQKFLHFTQNSEVTSLVKYVHTLILKTKLTSLQKSKIILL